MIEVLYLSNDHKTNLHNRIIYLIYSKQYQTSDKYIHRSTRTSKCLATSNGICQAIGIYSLKNFWPCSWPPEKQKHKLTFIHFILMCDLSLGNSDLDYY